MEIIKTAIDGPVIIEPKVFGDARGYFFESFSQRELAVLRLVVSGETDAEIAEKLNITINTVKFHVQSMKKKTGFRNRTELAVRARLSGLVVAE